MSWDELSAGMDEVVDAHLSDTVAYSTDDGDTFTDLPGFVLPFGESYGVSGLDPGLGTRWRVKMAKAIIPAPLRSHRVMHPKLGIGTVWRPSADGEDDQGRYWMADIQKVND